MAADTQRRVTRLRNWLTTVVSYAVIAGIPKCIICMRNIRRRRSFVNEMAIQIYRHRNDDDAVRRHVRRMNRYLATAAAIRRREIVPPHSVHRLWSRAHAGSVPDRDRIGSEGHVM